MPCGTCSGIFVPCITVFVRTENFLRQAAHFHNRRCVAAPVLVERVPFFGVRK